MARTKQQPRDYGGGFKSEPATVGQVPALATEMDCNLATWNALKTSIFPGASEDSIVAVLSYCRARSLDPMKKPCHIVPMKVKDAKTGAENWRDVIMPAIYDARATAARTMQFAGLSKAIYGENIQYLGEWVPEWCEMTMRRQPAPQYIGGEIWVPPMIEITHVEWFVECAQTTGQGRDKRLNSMWSRRKRGQLKKCCEANLYRQLFPDEIGGTPTADEVVGETYDGTAVVEDPARAEQLSKQLVAGSRPESAQAARSGELHPGGADGRPGDGASEPVTSAQPGEGSEPDAPTPQQIIEQLKAVKSADGLDLVVDMLRDCEFGGAAQSAINTALADARRRLGLEPATSTAAGGEPAAVNGPKLKAAPDGGPPTVKTTKDLLRAAKTLEDVGILAIEIDRFRKANVWSQAEVNAIADALADAKRRFEP